MSSSSFSSHLDPYLLSHCLSFLVSSDPESWRPIGKLAAHFSVREATSLLGKKFAMSSLLPAAVAGRVYWEDATFQNCRGDHYRGKWRRYFCGEARLLGQLLICHSQILNRNLFRGILTGVELQN